MHKLMLCEFMKLRRKPLFSIAMLLSFAMPLAFEVFFPTAESENAMEAMMSVLYQLGAPLLLMPLIVVLSSNMLFVEQDHMTLKNLMAVPVGRSTLVMTKMLVLLLFSVGFMACGSVLSLALQKAGRIGGNGTCENSSKPNGSRYAAARFCWWGLWDWRSARSSSTAATRSS